MACSHDLAWRHAGATEAAACILVRAWCTGTVCMHTQYAAYCACTAPQSGTCDATKTWLSKCLAALEVPSLAREQAQHPYSLLILVLSTHAVHSALLHHPPAAPMATGACSREDPQPKLSPPIMMGYFVFISPSSTYLAEDRTGEWRGTMSVIMMHGKEHVEGGVLSYQAGSSCRRLDLSAQDNCASIAGLAVQCQS